MKRYIAAFATLLLACGSIIALSAASADNQTNTLDADWLSTIAPTVSAVETLPDNQLPATKGYDCTMMTYRGGFHDEGTPQTGCGYQTPLGTIIQDQNVLVDGPNGTLLIAYQGGAGFIIPSPPGKSVVMAQRPSPIGPGSYMRVEPYQPDALQQVTYWGLPMQYDYVYSPSSAQSLKDGTGNNLFNPDTIAYSQNGEWMVVMTQGGGIAVYDTATWHSKIISWDLAPSHFGEALRGANFAVSNDGKYVAVNADLGDTSTVKPSLWVYDTDTCRDQSNRTAASSNGCEYRDLWNGMYRGKSAGTAIKDLVNAEYPRHVRFVDDAQLQFDGVHDRTDAQHFKVSRYLVTISQSAHPQYISLLGVGDSYIAGEGAFDYFNDTDTQNNKCHNSWHAYPINTGKLYFQQVRSVACSGARINDIDAGLLSNSPLQARESYTGQVAGHKKWKDRSEKSQKQIMSSFAPGYANQILFTDKYKPRVTLLSIGGNDVGFADIIKQCVSPLKTDTCYSTYEDRFELMQQIQSQYNRLVAVYKDVAASSGGSVYVIGYPQIAKVGGSCGDNVLMNSDEVKFSSDLTKYLDSVIQRAAASAGVYYVDTQNALNGYRLCEAPKHEAAMNGYTAGKDGGFTIHGKHAYFVGQESYHPTAFGYQLLGDNIVYKTKDFTAPMPAAENLPAPAINPNDPLLKNVPKTQRTTNMIIWRNPLNTALLIPGGTYVFETSVSASAIAYGTNYLLTLHSTPVVLSQGVNNGQDVRITIPADTPTGFHTLDIYGKDANGQSIDERQVVYIGTLEDLQQRCLGMPLSGNDEDGDGIDDTCDAGYFDPSLVPGLNDAPPDQLEVDDNVDVAAGDDTDDILVPVTDDGSAADTPKNTDNSQKPATSVQAASSPSAILATGRTSQLPARLPGWISAAAASSPSSVLISPAKVLGVGTNHAKQSVGHRLLVVWIILAVAICGAAAGIVTARRKHSA